MAECPKCKKNWRWNCEMSWLEDNNRKPIMFNDENHCTEMDTKSADFENIYDVEVYLCTCKYPLYVQINHDGGAGPFFTKKWKHITNKEWQSNPKHST